MSKGNTAGSKRLNTTFVVEVGVCVFLTAVFTWMFLRTYDWTIEAGLFPRLISGIGIISVLAYFAQITWQNVTRRGAPDQRILDISWTEVSGDSVKKTAVGVIAWALAFWLGVVLVGFHVAAPLYLFSQLVIYGGIKKWIAALAAVVCLMLIIFVYDELAGTTWNDPLLLDLFATYLR